MDKNLTKSITDLIDETLQELDELRKSRFSASEIKIEGPGDGIAGKPSNGALDAKKAEMCKDEDDKDADDDKDEDKDMDKGENQKADPGPVHWGEGSDKGAGPREQTGGGKVRGTEGTNSKADPGETHWTETSKSEDDKKDDKKKKKDSDKDEKDEGGDDKKSFPFMKKSLEESESLMKSYVEERVKPLEDKLTTILDLVNKIADQPVAPKGATIRSTPLFKSDSEVEPLSKSQVANKLFDLKKSGTRVDSADIARVEMGQDLQQIIKKYEIS
jgi:hypothetical protein